MNVFLAGVISGVVGTIVIGFVIFVAYIAKH